MKAKRSQASRLGSMQGKYHTFGMATTVIPCCLMILVLSPVNSEPCPGELPLNCNCSRPTESGWNISCEGSDLVNISRQLPPNTEHFHYTALELFVQLGDTDFSHVPQLKTLAIKDPGDAKMLDRRIYPTFGNDRMFQSLTMLQMLSININWEMESRLPNLFMGLVSLEVLDLSNTRLMNIDNLINSLQGLQNNTKVTTLNLWNIKTFQHSSSDLGFKLNEVLAPLSKSKLQVLNIGYNAFRSVAPGLLQYAPHLKKLIVRNNVLIPIVTSSLMVEVLLHPTLEDADFSEQGYRPATDSPLELSKGYSTSSTNIHTLPDFLRLLNHTPHDGSVRRQFLTPVHRNSNIPQPFLDVLKRYLGCFIMLYQDHCNIFKKECQSVRQILTDRHDIFCALLKLFVRWQFSGVHCSYLPAFSELISPHCGGCIVVPSLGSIKAIHMANVLVYDYVVMYMHYRDRPVCYYPNSSIEYMDMSGNFPHGFAEAYKVFDADISGLPNLKFYNTSHNSLRHLTRNLSTSFPALEYLDASHNLITFEGEKTFLGLAGSIQVIDFSHNLIKNVSVDRFAHLSNLRRLDLSYNLIDEFEVNISSSVLLEYLDLSANSLNSLPPFTISQLNTIALSNSSHMLHVNLQSNPLLCTCATKHFVNWIIHEHPQNLVLDADKYACTNKNSDRVALRSVSTAWWYECNQPTIFGSIGVFVTLVVFLLIIGYRKRFKVYRMWYRMTTEPSVLHDDEQHEFDASVCFDTGDDEWIQFEMKKYFRHIKVAYVDEMVSFGQRYPEVVDSCFQNSRRSILVLSPELTESGNLMYLVDMMQEKMQRAGRQSTIFVVRKPLSTAESSKVRINFREHPLCFKWRENNLDAQDLFWEKLIDVVRSPLDEGGNDTPSRRESRLSLQSEPGQSLQSENEQSVQSESELALDSETSPLVM